MRTLAYTPEQRQRVITFQMIAAISVGLGFLLFLSSNITENTEVQQSVRKWGFWLMALSIITSQAYKMHEVAFNLGQEIAVLGAQGARRLNAQMPGNDLIHHVAQVATAIEDYMTKEDDHDQQAREGRDQHLI